MVITDSIFWLVTLCIGLGTFFLRAVFVFALERIHLTEKTKVMLGFIPPAVISALVLPAFLLPGGHLPFPDGWERTVAGLAALLASWRFRNILATIGVGLGDFWGLQYLKGFF